MSVTPPTRSARHSALGWPAWAGGALVATLALAAIGWPARVYLDFDFAPFYLASRLVLSGGDPYDGAALRAAFLAAGSQGYAFGGAFAYPLPVALLVVPFALLPFAIAAPLWLVSQVAAIVGTLLALGRRLFGGNAARDVAFLFGLVAAMPATIVSLWTGQILGFVLAVVAIGLVLLHDDRPRLAGAVLALAVLKPQMFLLFLPVLLLVAPARWRIAQGLAIGAAALLIPSFVVRPGWVGEWIDAATGVATIPVAHANLWGPTGGESAWIGWLLLIALSLLYVVWWRRGEAPLPALYGAAVALSLASAPYAWAYYDGVLAVPAAVTLATAPTPGRRRTVVLVSLAIVLDLIPWPLYAGTYRTGADPYGALMPILLFLMVIASSWTSIARRGRVDERTAV